jgi:hypothetical protein
LPVNHLRSNKVPHNYLLSKIWSLLKIFYVSYIQLKADVIP